MPNLSEIFNHMCTIIDIRFVISVIKQTCDKHAGNRIGFCGLPRSVGELIYKEEGSSLL